MRLKVYRVGLVVVTLACSVPVIVAAQPRSAVAQVNRAIAAIDAKKYAEAEHMLRDVVKRYPNYYDARYELALVLSLQKKYQEALAECLPLCDSNLSKDSQRDHYFQLLGNLYAQLDDTLNAELFYRRGLKIFPTSARLHVEMAIRAAQRGDLDEALEEIESAISGDPSYPLSYYWGARFYRASTERLWVIFYAELFINLRPNSSKADEMSTIWYNVFREAIEEFDQNGRIILSREIRANAPAGATFPEAFSSTLSDAARILRFNRDFELPVASIDTLLSRFLDLWYERGLDTLYRNIIIERYRHLRDEGLLEAYVHVVAQYGKPMQFAEYAKQNRSQLEKLERWINKHRLVLDRTNYISRYRW
ncbi:MAG: tetratricopeptide repeat protein [Chlorobi bacterium]|nr:tetratricopeptide repeat protein [Chlorobiota bacterium]